MMKYLVYAVVVWNLIVFLLYGFDKRKAVKNKWRISEKSLILSAFLFGSLGAFLGMILFRHKTKHMKFKILVPLAVLFNVAIVVGFYYALKTGFIPIM